MIIAHLAALAGAVVLAVTQARSADWELSLLAVLLTLSVVSDVAAVDTKSQVKISGSFLSLVLAMVFLGGPPAALIGVVTMLVGWLRWHDRSHFLLNNVTAYAVFPLLTGLGFFHLIEATGLSTSDGAFYMLVFGVFVVALALNFVVVAGYTAYYERRPMRDMVRSLVLPVWPSELAAALLAMGIAFLYARVGLVAITLFGVVLFTFQYLLGELLRSQQRAQELQSRTRQLASLQVGLLGALLHTLDLRDRMTARHSAAVARYSMEIARGAGFSEEEQDLVHTAALLHDIGKFIFPDRILKGDHKLTDEDWNIIRMHPYQGARIVSQIEGYGSVGDIIMGHHERIDGKGYPRHLKGDEIPPLSRIISVADIYDVMTARDSYRKPISSFEAIRELRRVAGTQLDPYFVEVFINVLAGKDVRYRHGEDADFDAELALEKRVGDYAAHGLSAGMGKQEGLDQEPEDGQDRSGGEGDANGSSEKPGALPAVVGEPDGTTP